MTQARRPPSVSSLSVVAVPWVEEICVYVFSQQGQNVEKQVIIGSLKMSNPVRNLSENRRNGSVGIEFWHLISENENNNP